MNIEEFLAVLQDAADSLRGRDVRGIGAAGLVDEVISGLDCITPPFSVHDRKLWYDVSGFGEMPVVKFTPQYGEDKRTCDGLAYQLAGMEVTLVRELPLDMDLAGINRALCYAAAWERRQEAQDNTARLQRQLEEENEVIRQMQEILEQGA